MGDLSAHFSRSEFVCPHCGQVVVVAQLVDALERLRERIRRPVYIVSGYRCPKHNAAVGGAPRSQHLYGRAVDVARGLCTVQDALAVGFSGIGHRGTAAVHLDVRPGPTVTFID